MNADPAGTRSPHLDLDDLIAEANGEVIGDAARAHLAGCQQCRLEASRWNLVAEGVRSLAAAVPESAVPEAASESAVPGAAPPVRPAVPAHPQRAAWRGRPVPGGAPCWLAGSAAAALVLFVGVGEVSGLVHLRVGGSGTSAETVLTAVSGCTALEQASGTLERVNGSSLVVKTASGQPVTVTTTGSTRFSATGALRGAITDGASVTLSGPSFNGTIAAFSVIIADPAQQHPQPPPGMVVVKGTVSDASTAGFTVVTTNGTRVPVTTSGDTLVSVLNASLAQFPAGATIVAVGSAGPDGTLSARGVVAILKLPQPTSPAIGPLPPGQAGQGAAPAAYTGAYTGEELLARLDRPRDHGARRWRLIRPAPDDGWHVAARGAPDRGRLQQEGVRDVDRARSHPSPSAPQELEAVVASGRHPLPSITAASASARPCRP